MSAPQFVLPDFTLFDCGRQGHLLSDYLHLLSQRVSRSFDVFVARLRSSETLTKLSESDDLDQYLPRRFLVRCPAVASLQSIHFRAGAAPPGDELVISSHKTLSYFLNKRAPPGLRCVATLLGVDLDATVPVGDTGLAKGDMVVVTPRKPLKVHIAGEAPRDVMLPTTVTSLEGLYDYLGQPQTSRVTHEGRRLTVEQFVALSAGQEISIESTRGRGVRMARSSADIQVKPLPRLSGASGEDDGRRSSEKKSRHAKHVQLALHYPDGRIDEWDVDGRTTIGELKQDFSGYELWHGDQLLNDATRAASVKGSPIELRAIFPIAFQVEGGGAGFSERFAFDATVAACKQAIVKRFPDAPNDIRLELGRLLKDDERIYSIAVPGSTVTVAWPPARVYRFRFGDEVLKLRICSRATVRSVYYNVEKNRKVRQPVMLSVDGRKLRDLDALLFNVAGERQEIRVSRRNAPFAFLLPGSDQPVMRAFGDNATVQDVFLKLRFRDESESALDFGGPGLPVATERLRMYAGEQRITQTAALSALSRESPFRIVLADLPITFVFRDTCYPERCDPEASIAETAWRLSVRVNEDVEMVLDDFYILEGSRFGEIESPTEISLRPTIRPVYAFDRDGRPLFYRFAKFTTIREVKTIVAAGERPSSISVSFDGAELEDRLRLEDIPDFGRAKILGVSVKKEISFRIGQLLVSHPGTQRAAEVPSIKSKESFRITLLGDPVSEVRQSHSQFYKVSYDSAEYTVEEPKGRQVRRVPRTSTVQDFLNKTYEEPSLVVLLVNGHPAPLDATFDSIPASAALKVMRLIREQDRRTIGELKTGRCIMRAGRRVLVNSVEVFRAGSYKAEPSPPSGPREFAFHFQGQRRTFVFDYEAKVADACAAVYDVSHLPRFELFYGDERLSNDEFLFDIGHDGAADIEVRPVPIGRDEIFFQLPNGKTKSLTVDGALLIADLKIRLDDATGVGTDVDLICYGKQLCDEAAIGDSGISSVVYVIPKPVDSARVGQGPAEAFEFYVRGTQESYSPPYDEEKTVARAKLELSGKLIRPVNQLAVVDQRQQFCLDDSDRLAEAATAGRSFQLLIVDTEAELTPAQIGFLAKRAPDLGEKGRILFLECAGNPTLFLKTCKRRGLA
jgi:hypothetical protein